MISTRGRYSLRVMVDLAQHTENGFISLKDISQRQNISKKYLEQIIAVLNHSGLLQSSRGSQGGYRLNKFPKDYTVYEILCITEGKMAPVSCLENETNTCPRCHECVTLPVWIGLQKVVKEYLNSITLQDLIEKFQENSINDYSI